MYGPDLEEENCMEGDTETIKAVTKIIEEVAEDICDNYCKYRETADDDCLCDITRDGGSCPLDRLF